MSYLKTTFILTLMLAAFIALPAFSEGTIGANLSHAPNDVSWGLLGDYEHDADAFDFEVEGNIQSGDQYRGKVDTSLTVGFIKFSLNNTLKGYELDTLGRQNDLGASFVLPIGDAVEVAVGVFGRNGNPFQPRNALNTLTDVGFTETDFEGLGLENITLAEGISIKEGSALLGSLETEFEVNRFEIELQGLLELFGEGVKVHQVKSNISTDGALMDNLHWQAVVNIYAQLYGDVIEYESGLTLSTIYRF